MHYENNLYSMNSGLQPDRLRKEAESLLLSTITSIDILQETHAHTLPAPKQYFMKTMHNTSIQLFALYKSVYPLQSGEAKIYEDKNILFILNSDLTIEQRKDHLAGLTYQMLYLVDEALKTVLLDNLSDQAGNLLMNASIQLHILRQAIEQLNMQIYTTATG